MPGLHIFTRFLIFTGFFLSIAKPSYSQLDSTQTIKDSSALSILHTAIDSVSTAPIIVATDSFAKYPFSIAYSINVKAKNKSSIAETYNGGVKTVYVKNDKVKIVLSSLMRIQSIYFHYPPSAGKPATITKESGKEKYRYSLTPSQWRFFNKKYDISSCTFLNDSLEILGKMCRKVNIQVDKDHELSVYYFPAKQNNALLAAEPMFGCIPGLVIQYEYHKSGKQSITYTATEISFLAIPEKTFQVPLKKYVLKKYIPGQSDKITKKRLPKIEDGEEEEKDDNLP